MKKRHHIGWPASWLDEELPLGRPSWNMLFPFLAILCGLLCVAILSICLNISSFDFPFPLASSFYSHAEQTFSSHCEWMCPNQSCFLILFCISLIVYLSLPSILNTSSFVILSFHLILCTLLLSQIPPPVGIATEAKFEHHHFVQILGHLIRLYYFQ